MELGRWYTRIAGVLEFFVLFSYVLFFFLFLCKDRGSTVTYMEKIRTYTRSLAGWVGMDALELNLDWT